MRTPNELLATEFMFPDHFNDTRGIVATFHRSISPFYPGEKWAVRVGSVCVGKNSAIFEPSPSERDDAFYAEYRFDSIKEAVDAYNRYEAEYQKILAEENKA